MPRGWPVGREIHAERNAEIRRRRKTGETLKALALAFKLSEHSVWEVCNRSRARQHQRAYRARQKSPLSRQPPPLTAD